MSEVATLPRLAVGTKELMRILDCASYSALYRELAELGVKAYRPGKYRLKDVENALAKKSYEARKGA